MTIMDHCHLGRALRDCGVSELSSDHISCLPPCSHRPDIFISIIGGSVLSHESLLARSSQSTEQYKAPERLTLQRAFRHEALSAETHIPQNGFFLIEHSAQTQSGLLWLVWRSGSVPFEGLWRSCPDCFHGGCLMTLGVT